MYDIIIIGGGISGLYMANRLKELKTKVLVIEKGEKVGGKLKTEYDNEMVLYEKGAWRISNKHKYMKKLCRDLDIDIERCDFDYLYRSDLDNNIIRAMLPELKEKNGDLSLYDEWILKKDRNMSETIETMTGYNSILDMTSKINAYEAVEQDYDYKIIKSGFYSLIEKLSLLNNCRLMTEFHVTNIKKKSKSGYRIEGNLRISHNKYKKITIEGTIIIIACPPESIIDWNITKWMKPIIYSVRSLSLNHIYGYSKDKPEIGGIKNFHLTTDNVLSQIISSPYHNNWFQLSYSSGRIADFWFHLSLKSEKEFKKELVKNVDKMLDRSIDIIKIKNYYWEHAIHMWKPSFQFDLSKKLILALIPHPIQLPDLYMIGESFSGNQGWCEGALETVHECISYLLGKKKVIGKEWNTLDYDKNRYVIYQDRILNVDKWMYSHPGGIDVIKNHLYEDITDLWNSIHYSNYSYEMISNLQIGWKDSKTNKFYYL